MSIADKLTTIAENVDKVYQAGFDKGMLPMYYVQSFQYGWSSREYPQNTEFVIHLQSLQGMNGGFQNSKNIRSVTFIIDNEYNSVTAWSCFSGCKQLEVLDLSRAKITFNAAASFFDGCHNLKSVYGALDFSDVTTSNFNLFRGLNSLEDITFVPNSIVFSTEIHWSENLTKASITSIINGLSTETSGLTVTLSKTAVDNAFEDAEWSELEATKPNWTISLV